MSKDKTQISEDAIFERAVELQAEQTSHTEAIEEREARAAVAAELGVPPEFLIRAETELYKEAARAKSERASLRRMMLNMLLGSAALFVVVSFVWSPAPAPADQPWMASEVATDWDYLTSKGTKAWAGRVMDERRGSVGYLEVVHFDAGQAEGGRYFANLRFRQLPDDLGGYSSMRVWTRGAGLASSRIYIRKDKTHRWRSPDLPVTAEWTQHTVPFEDFDYQVGGKGQWETTSGDNPRFVDRLQLKLGYFVNDPSLSGTVYFDDLEFLP